jgi:hypothetical protein
MGIELKTSEDTRIVAKRGFEYHVADALSSRLKQLGDWDCIHLQQISSDSRTVEHLAESLGLDSQCAGSNTEVAPIKTSGLAKFVGLSLIRSPKRIFA